MALPTLPWWITASEIVYGAGALVAAWGMHKRSRWAIPAALTISSLNLLFIPFITLFGVYGIALLSTRAGRDQLRPLPPPLPTAPGSGSRGRTLQWAVCIGLVVVGFPACDAMFRYLDVRHVPVTPLWMMLVGATVQLWITVLIHELGHCVAAWACGYEVVIIATGPLALVRQDERWQLKWVRKLGAGGLAGIRPRTPDHLREHRMFFAAGGPIASLLFGVLLLGLFLVSPGRPWQILAPVIAIAAVVSLQTFVGNALPFRGGAYFTDGSHFFQLWRRSAEGERSMAQLRTLLPWTTLLRPRELSDAWIRSGVAIPDGSRDHMAGCMRAYEYHLDRGETAQAGEWLHEWRVLQTKRPGGTGRDYGLIEAAYFEARYRDHAATARELLAAARSCLLVEHYSICRAWAAVMLAEGDREAASELIAQARADLDRRQITGHRQFERGLLADLEEQASRISLPPTAVPGDAVIANSDFSQSR